MKTRFTVIITIGLLLRLAALNSELWLDEIWWLNIINPLSSITEIVSAVHDVGNHLLYSFYIYLISGINSDLLLRAPSIILGTLSILVIERLSASTRQTYTFIPALLLSCSAFFVLYSSEARGYAAVTFFALTSLYLLEAHQETPAATKQTVFTRNNSVWLCVSLMLGLLSQLIFTLWLAILVLYALYLWRLGKFTPKQSKAILIAFLPAIILLTLLYFVFIKDLSSTLGSQNSFFATLLETGLIALSGHTVTPSSTFLLALSLLISVTVPLVVIIEIRTQKREGCPRWFLFALSFLLFPAFALCASKNAPVYPRYFCIALALFYLLLGSFFSRFTQRRLVGITVSTIFLALFLTANAAMLIRIMRYGRGNYSAALAHVSAATVQDTVLITGDHALRHKILIDHFKKKFFDRTIIFVSEDQVTSAKHPQWYLIHFEDPAWTPPASVSLQQQDFSLDSIYPFSGLLSGWNLALYRDKIS